MENKRPLFTIVVPVYNVEKYLRQCLDSVLKQKYEDYECIVVNDGSTDGSELIAKEYIDKDYRFSVYSQENEGLSGARNTGIKHSKGKYIVLLDSDDFIKVDALEALAKIVEKDNPDVIVNSSIAYYGKSNKAIPYKWIAPKQWECEGQLLDIISNSQKYVLAAWCLVVRREYLLGNELLFYPRIKHEDELWVPQVIVNAKKIAINSEPYYYYRCDRSGSITQTFDIKKCFDKIFIVDELIRFSERQDESNGKYIKKRCAKIITGTIREAEKYKKNEEYSKLINEIQKRVWILKFQNKKKYRILYVFCNIFGVHFVSMIWNFKK